MKAPAFNFQRVQTLSQAFSAYEESGDAIYIAGGHSVVPSLALRLQAPERLIDISGIAELAGIKLADGVLRIGAMTRHAEVMSNPLIRQHAPLLAMAGPFVAHPAIRNRGTIGGNLAHADPASEFPAVALALDADFEIAAPDGTRRVRAQDFFVDLYETACAPGEILVAVHVPAVGPNDLCAFDEIARRRGDYAMVGCAAKLTLANGLIRDPRIAFLSVGATPVRAKCAEAALHAGRLTPETVAKAQDALTEDLDPLDDPNVPREMRLHLARVLLGRVLGKMVPNAGIRR